MKRSLCGLILLLLMVAACNSAEPEPVPLDEPMVLRVVGRKGAETSGLRQVLGEWEVETGHRVELLELPYEYLQQQIVIDVLTKRGLYDVVIIDDPWFPVLAAQGYLTPLLDFGYQTDPDFIDISLAVCQWPPPESPRPVNVSAKETPKLYALPLVGNVQLMWYRRDILPQPPATMVEFRQAVEQAAQQKPPLYGYAYRGSGGNALVAEFNAWNWSYGGNIFDEQWQVVINQPPSVQALTDFLAVAQFAPPGVEQFDSADVEQSMLRGEVLMAITWPTSNYLLQQSPMGQNIGVALVPKERQTASQLGHWLMAIPVTAKHKEAAFSFITWATSQPVMKKMAQTGSPPTRKSVIRDPELVAQFDWFPILEQALANARPRPRMVEWNRVVHILSVALVNSLQQNVTPEEALQHAESNIQQVMFQAGVLP